ncbi:WD40 repeat, subgroup [Candidatus Moduliflexus flocculans]|uniref:WD40 repeat, subgroup n=1 Tax=Candidatus Moduliflexus flocculans TaxID=1499966 RepID=A0A081BRC7_9BACT|nr:WD40 repeat, subgroup [Candidatus Moduliflexus flocculans]
MRSLSDRILTFNARIYNHALYEELHGTDGILQNYLEDRLAKIVPQIADGHVILRSMLKTMITATGASETRKFVTLREVQRELTGVLPEIVAEGLQALSEERIIETRGQDGNTSYSLSHEVMVPKVQSWYSEHEMERKKAQETLGRRLAKWKSSNKVVLLTEKQVERIRKWIGGEGLSAEAEQLLTQSQQAYEERQRKEAEQERRIRRNRNAFQMALVIGLVIALILSAIAFWQRNVAEQQKTEAQTQKQEAEKQTLLAQQETKRAEQEKIHAEEQKNTALKTQSLFLSDLARQQNERQNYGDAMLLALEALPKNMKSPDCPYVPEAEFQLYRAIMNIRERLVLKGDKAVFSKDGKKIITTDGNTARVWDAASGVALATLTGHEERVTSAAFSPDEMRIITASEDRTSRV